MLQTKSHVTVGRLMLHVHQSSDTVRSSCFIFTSYVERNVSIFHFQTSHDTWRSSYLICISHVVLECPHTSFQSVLMHWKVLMFYFLQSCVTHGTSSSVALVSLCHGTTRVMRFPDTSEAMRQ